MQIVIDKEKLEKMLKVMVFALTGADYIEIGKSVEEIIAKVGYIELPEKHGRLIDADELNKQIKQTLCENCDRRRGLRDWGNTTKRFIYEIGDAPCRACETDDTLDWIEDAPTIIGATESEG